MGVIWVSYRFVILLHKYVKGHIAWFCQEVHKGVVLGTSALNVSPSAYVVGVN